MERQEIRRKFYTTLIVAPVAYVLLTALYQQLVATAFAPLEAQNSLFFVFLNVGLIHLALWPVIRFYWREPYSSLLGAGKKNWHVEFINAQIFLAVLFLLSEPLFLVLNWKNLSFHWQDNWTAWVLWLLPMLIAVALQASGEEIFFRGFMQGKLREMGVSRGRAILIPAFVWALIHQAQFDLVPLKIVVVVQIFVLGLILGDWFDRTASLIGPILVHFLMNVFNSLIYGNTLRQSNFDILQANFDGLRVVYQVFYLALGTIGMMVAYTYFVRKRLPVSQ